MMIHDEFINDTVVDFRYTDSHGPIETVAGASYKKEEFENTTNVNWNVKGQSEERLDVFSGRFSPEYLRVNLKKCVSHILIELNKWKENFDQSNSVLNIHGVKKLIHDYDRYFFADSEARVFLSILKLLFKNDNWHSLSLGQLSSLIEIVKNFYDGVIDDRKLKVFCGQLFDNGFIIFDGS